MILRLTPALLLVAFIVSLASNAHAENNGISFKSGNPSGSNGSGATCSGCHSGGSYSYTPYIYLSDYSPYEGQTVNIQINMNNNNTTSRASAGGFNLSASSGTLYESSSELIKENNEITHSTTKNTSSSGYGSSSYGDLTWGYTTGTSSQIDDIRWVAPSTSGSKTLYVCTNAANHSASSGNKDTAGDAVDCRTRSVTVYNRPVISSFSGTDYFTEGTASIIDSSISLTADSSSLNRAEMSIYSGYSSSQDELQCPSTAITCSWNSSTGTLTLSGTYSKATYDSAIQGIKYNNTSQNPSTSNRYVKLRTRDTYYNYSGYAYKTISVSAVNDAPSISSFNNSASYTENASAITVESSISLTDVDSSNLNYATIELTTNFQNNQDQLLCPITSLSCSYNSTSGVLTLQNSASKATYDSAIQGVKYQNTSNSPNTSTRTIRIRIRDTSNAYSSYVSKSLSVVAVNDAPTISSFNNATSYTENNAAVIIESTITLSDVDSSNLNYATLELTTNFQNSQDQLICPTTSLSCSYNSSTGILTLQNLATKATYDSAIQGIKYQNTSNNPNTASRTIRVRVRDSSNLFSSYASKSISIIASNDAPTISNYSGSSAFTEDGAAVAVDSTINLSDIDSSNLNYATMGISANFSSGNDVLNCPTTSLSCSFSSISGILTLSGSASIATYDAALQGITFQNTSDNPSTANRTVRILIRDTANATSVYANKTVTVTASNDVPLISNVDAVASFTENGSAVIIDSSITLSDIDNTQFNQALVEISGNYQSSEDSLICPATSLACSYSAGTLTFSGTANIATYQSALQATTYNNLSENPNTGNRTIRMRVRDTSNASSSYDSTSLQINALNDAPVMSGVDSAFTYTENDAPAFVDSNITITDIDSSNLSSATVRIFSGKYINGQDFLNCPASALNCNFNTTTGVLTLSNSASIATYKSAMQAVTYHNTSNNPVESTRRMEFQVTDSNGAVSNIDFKGIMVVAVNDNPVISQGASTSVIMSEEGTPSAFSLTLNATDAENETITWSISSQAANGSASASGTGASKAINYIPNNNFSGADSFIVQASDSAGNSDTITVNVTINATQDAPVITEGTSRIVNISEDNSPTAFALTLNATDADNDTLTWSISSAATNGSATASGTGISKAIGYTPNANFSGADSFIVNVNDGQGNTDTITVTVNIASQADSPIITEGASTTVIMDEDSSPSAFTLTLNASDADADTLNWSISSAATNGVASASGPGTSKAISYTPAANFNGADSFIVSVTDGSTSDTITVNVTVNAQADSPVITEGSSIIRNISEDNSPTAFALTLNATDVDGNTLNWSISSAASNGTATASGTGASKAISYTPNNNYNGADNFVVSVNDGTGNSDTIAVTVNIAAQSDSPVITEGASIIVNMSEDASPTAFSLNLNASDADADSLSWSISSQATNGNASATGTGTNKAISYSPNANYNGADSFVVSVTDGNTSDTITVNVNVAARADAPVITEGTSTSVQMSQDGVNFQLTLNASDADNDSLSWSISSAASNGTAGASGTGASKAITYTPTGAYTGPDSFVVQVSDGNSGTDTITVNVTVSATLSAPSITQGESTLVVMSEDATPTAFSLTLNATDPNADPITWSISSGASNGTASATGTGTSKAINYTPTLDYTGNDSFIVNVDDGNGNNDTITVNVTVQPRADSPIITNGTATTVVMDEDATPTAFALNLAATDVDGDTLNWSISSPATNGSAVATGSGNSKAINYTPNSNYNGSDSFIVRVDDGTGNSDTFAVTVNITGQNDAPVITQGANTSVNMDEDGSPTPFSLTLNASDADNDTLTWSISSQAAKGSATVTGTGISKAINYTPSANLNGADSFIVSISDGNGNNDTITVNVNISAQADTPVIAEGASVTVSMSEDSAPTAFALTLNATDADNDTLNWSISSQAANGTAIAAGTGASKAINYTSTLDYTGNDSFIVAVDDGTGNTQNITVNVTINPQNDAPVITEGTSVVVNIDEDNSPTTFALSLNASDPDGDTLTWSISSAASNGTAIASGTGISKAINYTPNANVNGADSFVVNISDGNGNNDSITVTVNIAAQADSPIITEGLNTAVSMSENGAPTAFSLTLNATDADADPLTWSITSAASNGTATTSGTGASKAISYTPNLNYNGADSFVVNVNDGNGNNDTIIVNVTVSSVANPPIITQGNSANVVMSEDATPTAFALTLNASDADGDTLTWSITSPATNGSASTSGTGLSKAINYSPTASFNGVDSFVVNVADGTGNSDTITVNVSINAVNDAPVITEGASINVTMSEDSSPNVFSLSLNATDPDADTLTWSISTVASNGTASASGTGNSKAISYTPNANFNGSDSFVVSVSDGSQADLIMVNVTVAAQSDNPVITQGASVAVVMSEDGNPTTFNLVLNASDNDNDTLTWSISSAATNGSASVSGIGTNKAISYAPNANFNGTDSFNVQVNDGTSNTDTIVVNVTINSETDAPVITEGDAISVNMSEDASPTAFALSLNATDNDNDTLTWSISSVATNGSASVSGTGNSKAISYAPNADFNGSDSFVVEVNDGALTDTITVNVNVSSENDAPLITNGASAAVVMDEDSTPGVFNLTLSATDTENDSLTWTLDSTASNGVVTINTPAANSTAIIYNPVADFNGNDSFVIQVDDGNKTASIIVNVSVTSQPDIPFIAEGANITVNMDEDSTPTAFSLTLNASDGDNDTLTWSISSNAANGTASTSGTGYTKAINYLPNVDYAGTDSFVVEVSDGTGNINTINVNVNIANQNDAPVITQGGLINSILSTNITPSLISNLAATDLDNDILSWSISTPASNGSASVTPTGNTVSSTYTPTGGYLGSDVFIITVTDGNGGSDSISINVTVSNGDLDNDGVNDDVDNCPIDANPNQENNDTDSEGDACDDDDDNDGITDDNEIKNGLNPLVPAVISIPADITTNAKGFLTNVNEGQAQIVQGAVIIPLTHNGNHAYRPGTSRIDWLLGSAVIGNQNINVTPLINFYPDQITVEGSIAEVKLSVNGPAITYPVTVNYTISGTADNTDHNLTNGSITFNQGDITQSIFINIANDNLDESTETIVLNLSSITNATAGSISQHTVYISETNIAPKIDLEVKQAGDNVAQAYIDRGIITVTANVIDPGNVVTYSWFNTDNALSPPSNINSFTIDTSTISAGVYNLSVDVSDGTITVRQTRLILISDTAPTLSINDDTDKDSIDDLTEGLNDSDNDRIPDYLDRYSLPGILGISSELTTGILQTVPGLTIRPGNIALASGNNSPLIDIKNISEHGGLRGGVATSINDTYSQYNGIFDFEISGILPGSSASIVIPLHTSIRAGSEIRKYVPGSGWQAFSINSANTVSSAAGSPDACPEAGSSEYTIGLSPFHYCIQLTLEDGGPNDVDGIANGVIVDPSTLAISDTTNVSEPRESSACTDNIQNNCADERGSVGSINPLFLLTLFILFIRLRITRHKR